MAARCTFEDLALVEGPGLAALLDAVWDSPRRSDLGVLLGHGAGGGLAARVRAGLGPERAQRVTADVTALGAPSDDELASARHTLTFHLQLLVARGRVHSTGTG